MRPAVGPQEGHGISVALSLHWSLVTISPAYDAGVSLTHLTTGISRWGSRGGTRAVRACPALSMGHICHGAVPESWVQHVSTPFWLVGGGQVGLMRSRPPCLGADTPHPPRLPNKTPFWATVENEVCVWGSRLGGPYALGPSPVPASEAHTVDFTGDRCSRVGPVGQVTWCS